ncbi:MULTISPECIES: helix-turn-helix domain-containing protein [Halorussus]|uniref:helix-turn-helix domain-containing protein n=1 Tax=Halorussus TaxID=1070314 RepID=UPI00209D9C39|nr:helix-turn-helix domain-containing protein [Halorussus vallis]USZ76175.1 helix-turn-helix domain-containing protein [Halorussus vallis]
MSVVVELTVAPDAFALGRALGTQEGMLVELERVVPTPNSVMPFLWIRGADAERLEADVRESAYIENLTPLDRIGDEVLYRVEWTGEYEDLVEGIVRCEGTILEAAGNGQWNFQLRFLDHEHVADFYNYCTDHDITIHVDRVYTLTEESFRSRVFDLTPEQREALVLGLRRGYFSTPREVAMEELADEMGISQQAFSDRLRRGNEKVLTNVLLPRLARSE